MKDFSVENYEKVEDYIQNRMSAQIRADFENLIQKDSELKSVVANVALVKQMAQRHALKQKIQAIHDRKMAAWKNQEEPAKPTIGILRTFVRLGSAACVALVLFGVFLLNSDFKAPNGEAFIERGNNNGLPQEQQILIDIYNNGIKAVQNQDYATAIKSLQIIESSETANPYYRHVSRWFLAVANASSNPEETLRIISSIENTPDFKYKISTIEMWKVKLQSRWNALSK